jgi:hypothetical protein
LRSASRVTHELSVSAGPTRWEFPEFHFIAALPHVEPLAASIVDLIALSWGAGMARADEYRRYAAECVRVAQTTSNPNDKQVMLEMAQKWHELAEKVERKDQAARE